jgi:hypothetical protein
VCAVLYKSHLLKCSSCRSQRSRTFIILLLKEKNIFTWMKPYNTKHIIRWYMTYDKNILIPFHTKKIFTWIKPYNTKYMIRWYMTYDKNILIRFHTKKIFFDDRKPIPSKSLKYWQLIMIYRNHNVALKRDRSPIFFSIILTIFVIHRDFIIDSHRLLYR